VSAVADDIAERLLDARRQRRQIVSAAVTPLADAAEAYRIQDAVLRELDGSRRPWLWKVSPPAPALGIVAAPVPPSCCFSSPARVAAGDYHMLGLEAEIAFRFGRDLPPRTELYGDGEVRDAVEAILVTIELVDTRLADWRDATALWRLADFQSNGALILGSGRSDWRGIDLTALDAELWIGGALAVRARGAHPVGDPANLLAWMANHCAQRCGGLRAGDVVTTGTWTGLHLGTASDVVEARFPAVGEAKLILAR
jgi:2-keto-4-pentenoate hydratase